MVYPLALRLEQVENLIANHHDKICLPSPISQTSLVRIYLDSDRTFTKINQPTNLLAANESSRQLRRDGLGIFYLHKLLANCDKYAGKLFP